MSPCSRLVLVACLAALALPAATPATSAATTTAAAEPLPILGTQVASAERLVAWYERRGATPDLPLPISELARVFVEEGAVEGVRGDVAFAQSALETGFFTFPPTGQVRAEDNNYGGLGAEDGGARGEVFDSPREGVRAQVQHLRAYADPTVTAATLAAPLVDTRFDLVEPKGKAPDWDDLGGGNWATDPDYAAKILAYWAEIAATPEPPGATPPPAPGYPPPALPPPPPPEAVIRVAGSDRFATAARAAAVGWGDGARVVHVTSGRAFADALAAGPAAARDDAPLLLVEPDRLPDATGAALATLRPGRVVVHGGTAAVAPAVVDAVQRLLPDAAVVRVGGADRFATAAAVAAAGWPDGAETAYVASGGDWVDAVAAGPAAAAAGAPLLLVTADDVPDATAAAIAELGVSRVVVAGGPATVGDGVLAALAAGPAEVERAAGPDRWATAAALAERVGGAGGGTVGLASGADWPDALAAGPALGRAGGPLLLVTRDDVPDATVDALAALRPATAMLFGGSAVIGEAVVEAVTGVLTPAP